MTREPICAECSTRYEGVNYSHEGLRMLHAQRAAGKGEGRWLRIAGVLAMPVLLCLTYASYLLSFRAVMNLIFLEGG